MVQKEGPVSDAKWSPANAKGSGQFVVVCGTMPAIATLYDLKAKPIFDFGMAHRNTVSSRASGILRGTWTSGT
jgi:translation initiation factor 2A